MNFTRHMIQRMRQRAFSKLMVESVFENGYSDHRGRIELNSKEVAININEIEYQINRLKAEKKSLEAIKKRGGAVVVVDGDLFITTYSIFKS